MTAIRRLTFDDLFENRGSADLRYRTEAEKLDGVPVEIQGVMVAPHAEPPRLLLAESGGDCPDCAPLPVAVIALPGLVAPPGVVPGLTRVVVQGTLRVGFAVDAEHYASFVRIEAARAVATDPA